jgi:hypothetical protein
MPTCCIAPRSTSAMNGSPAIWSEKRVQRCAQDAALAVEQHLEEMLIGLG